MFISAGTLGRCLCFGGYWLREFLFGSTKTLRGKQEVVAGWAPFFAGPKAPFSWEPDQVEVLESGSLALSTGVVMDAPGLWRVVFDKGGPAEEATRP